MPNTTYCPPIVWIDLETTGLDPMADEILEVAAATTTHDFQSVDKGFHALVRPPAQRDRPQSMCESLDEIRMSVWAHRTHSANGLLDDMAEKWDTLRSLWDVEEALCVYIADSVRRADPTRVHHHLGLHAQLPEKPPLGGSSVGGFDRPFLRERMPRVFEQLHYRVVDVSSAREMARRIWPGIELPPKSEIHRAQPDILTSVAHARWFMEKAR